MLDLNSTNTAADLASVLVTQGIKISPKGGTLLSKLSQCLLGAGVGDLTGVTADGVQSGIEDTGYLTVLVESSNAHVGTDENEHTQLMQTLAKEIGCSVSNTIAFCRNTVNPIVKDVCETISDKLDQAGKGGTITRFDGGQRFLLSNGTLVVNILENGPDALFSDSAVLDELKARARLPFKNVNSPTTYPALTSVEVFEQLSKAPSTQLEKDVVAYVQSVDTGYDELLLAYNQAYLRRPGVAGGVTIKEFIGDLTICPLMVLALGLSLSNDMPEGTIGNANTIDMDISQWICQLKNILEVNVESYQANLANKVLVTSSATNNFVVDLTVNKEIFTSYLEDGGSTEAVLGCVFSDQNYDYDNLLVNKIEYENRYEARTAEAQAYAESNRLAIFKNTLRECLITYIFEAEEGAIRTVSPMESRQALDLLLKKIYVDALDCPHEVVRMVVCNTLFIGTDAEEILVNIDHYCTKNENLTVRDASALVVLDYITKYLVAQMDVKRQF